MQAEAEAVPSLLGQRLGRYEIISRLAIGGMAEVWLARTGGRRGRKLVLKTMLPARAASPELVRMFETEAAIGARLEHPNLVSVVDSGRIDDRFFIAMEHIDGVNLRQLVARLQKLERRMPLPVLLGLVSDVCRGLHSAHNLRDRSGPLQFIHRDVSPENIMVTRTGCAKLIDFGAARTTRLWHSASRFVGKLGYVAPERIAGQGEDLRCDIYSLGVVLYECLAGVRPFDGPEETLVARILAGHPRPLAELVPGVPAELDRITRKALAGKPADRYASAAALAADLDSLSLAIKAEALQRGDAQPVDGGAGGSVLASELFDDPAVAEDDAKTLAIEARVLRDMLHEVRDELVAASEEIAAPVETPAAQVSMVPLAPAPRRARPRGRSSRHAPSGTAPLVSPATPPIIYSPVAAAESSYTPVPMTAVGPAPCAQASPASGWMFERLPLRDEKAKIPVVWRAALPLRAPNGPPKLDVTRTLERARPALANGMGLSLYRLLRQVALEDVIGIGSSEVARLAGRKLGRSLGLRSVEDFISVCRSLRIGIIRMPVMTDVMIHVDIYECAACRNTERSGCALCPFEGGLVAGIVEGLVGHTTEVREVSCIGGCGDEACGFDLAIGVPLPGGEQED
jgi:predicted hydrocarbon binding protein